jgi:acyl-CoA thioester hydrolase
LTPENETRVPAREFRFAVRVYYEDTDAAGLAYHGAYLRWLERARSEWLRECGFSQHELHARERMVFAVAALNIVYARPARLDDLLEVRSRIARLGGASLEFAQDVLDAAARPLCEAEVRIACLDSDTYRPRRLPVSLRRMFAHVD